MHKDLQKLSLAGLLISLGIIYGDIGTSPLYVFKAIVGAQQISETLDTWRYFLYLLDAYPANHFKICGYYLTGR